MLPLVLLILAGVAVLAVAVLLIARRPTSPPVLTPEAAPPLEASEVLERVEAAHARLEPATAPNETTSEERPATGPAGDGAPEARKTERSTPNASSKRSSVKRSGKRAARPRSRSSARKRTGKKR